MAYVITSNTIAGRDNSAPAPALREDGENYPFRMFYDNNQRIIDADTPTECVSVLIPGYEDVITEELSLSMRIDYAHGVRLATQTSYLSTLDEDEVASLQEWEWEQLSVQSVPAGWGGEDKEDVWSSEIPLVLVTTDYAPHTEIPRPISSEGDYKFVSNIYWIDPTEEIRLLNSLHRLGWVAFGAPDGSAAR